MEWTLDLSQMIHTSWDKLSNDIFTPTVAHLKQTENLMKTYNKVNSLTKQYELFGKNSPYGMLFIDKENEIWIAHQIRFNTNMIMLFAQLMAPLNQRAVVIQPNDSIANLRWVNIKMIERSIQDLCGIYGCYKQDMQELQETYQDLDNDL
jgi:hypothetical protein